jgi:hypothetical protein
MSIEKKKSVHRVSEWVEGETGMVEAVIDLKILLGEALPTRKFISC